jgi:hypothetical protein
MRLEDYVTLNFNNNMSTATVFFDIEKDFDGTLTYYPHKLSEIELSTSLIKLIAFFLTNRKLNVQVEGKFSTPRDIASGVPKGSLHAPILYNIYIGIRPLKAAICPSAGRGFAEHVPVATRKEPLLDGELLEPTSGKELANRRQNTTEDRRQREVRSEDLQSVIVTVRLCYS